MGLAAIQDLALVDDALDEAAKAAGLLPSHRPGASINMTREESIWSIDSRTRSPS